MCESLSLGGEIVELRSVGIEFCGVFLKVVLGDVKNEDDLCGEECCVEMVVCFLCG